jgi:FkbM family methyltransferase
MTARLGRAVLKRWPVSLGKVLLWRVINRLNSRLGVDVIGRTKWGGAFRCSLRDLVQSRIYYTGVWEPSLTAIIADRLAPGDVFIDIGANVGYFTVLAGQLVGDSGKVIAIEASPRIHDRLCENVRLNGLSNVVAHNCAVAEHDGTATVYSAPETNVGSTSLIPSAWADIPESSVETHPLDHIVSDEELRSARMIKIDIEGLEGPVLRSLAPRLSGLRRDLEIVVELAPSSLARFGMTADGVLAEMQRAGFAARALRNSYEWDAWYETAPQDPMPLRDTARSQTDLLFTRTTARARASHESTFGGR